MEKAEMIRKSLSPAEDELLGKEHKDLISSLRRVKNWNDCYIYQYQGFWFPSRPLPGMISFHQNFQARDTDVLLITLHKSGTTWLKALTFSIVNRNLYPPATHPLLTASPHALVPFFELDVYGDFSCPDLDGLPSPRIFATHAPYSLLPPSVKAPNRKLVYMCRNPLDLFVSYWHFHHDVRNLALGTFGANSLELAVEMFCEGVHSFGPFCEHVLEYWRESIARPEEVLFLKYEDMKEDPISHVRRLAAFLGFPFSAEEEAQGVAEEITRLCSFESLSGLEANRKGKFSWGIKKSSFFRKGQVGDWVNHLTPSLANRIITVVQQKLSGSGLSFNLPPTLD